MKKTIKKKLFRLVLRLQIIYSHLWIKLTKTDKWTYREKSKTRDCLTSFAFKLADIKKVKEDIEVRELVPIQPREMVPMLEKSQPDAQELDVTFFNDSFIY